MGPGLAFFAGTADGLITVERPFPGRPREEASISSDLIEAATLPSDVEGNATLFGSALDGRARFNGALTGLLAELSAKGDCELDRGLCTESGGRAGGAAGGLWKLWCGYGIDRFPIGK